MSADAQPIGSVFKLFALGGNESIYDAVEINGAAGVRVCEKPGGSQKRRPRSHLEKKSKLI